MAAVETMAMALAIAVPAKSTVTARPSILFCKLSTENHSIDLKSKQFKSIRLLARILVPNVKIQQKRFINAIYVRVYAISDW